MKTWTFIFSVVLATLVSFKASGKVNGANHGEYHIAGTQTLELVSKANGSKYSLYIQLPRSYASSNKKYPVVLLQDSSFTFPITSGTVAIMSGRDMAEVIIVGMSYADNLSPAISRTRDYTPTYAPNEKGTHSAAAQRQSGKAGDYLNFIDQQVFPLLAKHYRIDETQKIFAGHSFGSLLGLYALFTQPDLFAGYILGSPSLWYDDFAIARMENKYASQHKALAADVVMYVGSEEKNNAQSDMVKDLLQFAEKLKSRHYQGLKAEVNVIDEATHFSVFSLMIPRALKKLLPKGNAKQ